MEVCIGRRKIPIQIDPEDWERFKNHSLSVTTHGYVSSNIYLGRVNGKYQYRRDYLHRLILNAPRELFVDHINHDKRDNRRQNLRLANFSQSQCNTRNRTGKYKGVFFSKQNRNWCAQINHRHIGSFASEDDAARAYNKAARKLHGEYAYQNVIELDDENVSVKKD